MKRVEKAIKQNNQPTNTHTSVPFKNVRYKLMILLP